MDEPLVQIRNLTKTFPLHQTVLKNLNLTLPQGEMIGIVGPDGAGKTTLLRIIASLLKSTSGEVTVLGFDASTQAEKIKMASGYMPQRFGLYEDLTVLENLELYAALRGLKKEEKLAVFTKLLEFTGLNPFQTRRAGALSGGMKQKLGLACTLITKPKMLILDEPTVGVDPISRRELWKMVLSLVNENVSILWSTAYLNEAEKCARIVMLNKGEILYQGPPADLTQKMEGRVFLMKEVENKREYLSALEKREDVVDVLIQGSDIRIVSAHKDFDQGEPTQPRLEDAFVDLLGGRIKKTPLSEAAPTTACDGKEEVIAKDLVKKFNSFVAVDQINFSMKKGEIFGLLGPNGAGKSTTFKMLCGLLKPTSGSAQIGGLDLSQAAILARSKIGYMAQKFSLYGNLTVSQNLKFFAGIYKADGKNIQEKLEINDLIAYKETTSEILPAGIKQKLALAVATIHWPEILFLDEPTSGMDPVSRRQFWSEMNGLARKGKTILVSTHFMDEAENCDRIGLIYQGKMIHLDTPDNIKKLARTEENQNPTLEDAFLQLLIPKNAE
ncbi:MAG TPA: ATP-binding cassette domain-containing protein [Chlamydiales bacterium]|nr:ATP-binding cassette domain-containing protein [Chlamydiales bacterium]